VITGVITSVLATLMIAGIMTWIKGRRLYVIVPKLYLTTTLSDGQIVSLTLINCGFLPEEDVALTFRSSCKFELLGTSKSTLTVNGHTLSLPKLTRNESVSVLLLFENSKFDEADVESVESKGTKGKVVDSKEKASSVGQALGIWLLLIMFLGIPFFFGTFVGSEMKVSAWDYITEKLELMENSKQLAGYKIQSKEIYGSGQLKGALDRGKIKIEISEIVRRSNILYINYGVTNNTKDVLLDEAWFDGMAGDGPLSYKDRQIENFGIPPERNKSSIVKVYKPETDELHLIKVRAVFQNSHFDSLRIEQVISLN